MDFQRLQFAAYLRDQAMSQIDDSTRNMLRGEADAYRKEHLVRIATEIFEEVDDIAESIEANANDRRAKTWEKLSS